MGQPNVSGPDASQTPPPRWWTVDGAGVSLELLERGPLPDGEHPDDIPRLHGLVRFLARENRLLRERLDAELKHRYGSSSERRRSGEGSDEGKDTQSPPAPEPETPNPAPDAPGTSASSNPPPPESENPPQPPPPPKRKKPGHGRRPISRDLPRDEVRIPPEGKDEAPCGRCGGSVHYVGEPVESYRYDYVPGHIRVRVLIRRRCACDDPTCDAPFRIAKLPPEPIPKGRATAGFLAHLLVIKFADHCPLYRFRKILLRQGVDLPLSTLVDYCAKATDLLKPLWALMKQRVLLSSIVGTDDTSVRARLPGKKGVLKGHLWVYRGDEAHRYAVFEFSDNWKADVPQAFLETFHGYIQADGYKGYDKLFEKGSAAVAVRLEVGCWSHARRKWVKAKGSSPRTANQALDMLGQLFAIEKVCNEHVLSPDQRRYVRQDQSAPILEKFRTWMEELKPLALPKSPVAAAIEYAQNQWIALLRFLEDGRLSIDNNAVERELRGVALGRKNWLAAGSEVGGETAAIAYTMISSAAACGVEPVAWLTSVLEQIVSRPPDQLAELLPDQWNLQHSDQFEPAASSAANQSKPAGQAADPAQVPAMEPTAPGAAPASGASLAHEDRSAAPVRPRPTSAAPAGSNASADRVSASESTSRPPRAPPPASSEALGDQAPAARPPPPDPGDGTSLNRPVQGEHRGQPQGEPASAGLAGSSDAPPADGDTDRRENGPRPRARAPP